MADAARQSRAPARHADHEVTRYRIVPRTGPRKRSVTPAPGKLAGRRRGS